jgi:uncharacterized protein with beta-barrel porin domain
VDIGVSTGTTHNALNNFDDTRTSRKIVKDAIEMYDSTKAGPLNFTLGSLGAFLTAPLPRTNLSSIKLINSNNQLPVEFNRHASGTQAHSCLQELAYSQSYCCAGRTPVDFSWKFYSKV